MKLAHLILLATVFGVLAFSGGCFSSSDEDLKAFLQPHEAEVTMEEYTLESPDQLTIISTKIPQLTGTDAVPGQTQIIRPDGKISLEEMGEIYVAGKTPRQVAEIISEKMSQLYKLAGDYPVDVRVTNLSKFYYVVGQVQRPGAQPFDGRESTLSALCKAIPTNLAWKEEIQVIRPAAGPGERSYIFALNFKRMAEHGDMSRNVLLREGDVIYVPPTILASIGLTISEIVNPILSGASAVTVMSGTP